MIELAFALALVSQDATTTCTTSFGITTCNTQQRQGFRPMEPMQPMAPMLPQPVNPMDGFYRGLEAGRDMSPREARSSQPNPRCAGGEWWIIDCSRAEHDAAREQRENTVLFERVRREAIALIRAGDCPGAINKALEGNDLGFATEVRQFCAPSPPASSLKPPAQ